MVLSMPNASLTGCDRVWVTLAAHIQGLIQFSIGNWPSWPFLSGQHGAKGSCLCIELFTRAAGGKKGCAYMLSLLRFPLSPRIAKTILSIILLRLRCLVC